MNKLRFWCVVQFFAVALSGTLLHFLYDFTGENIVAGLFSPVNESPWEHLKLLFFPLLICAVIGFFYIGGNYCGWFFSQAAASLLGMGFIITAFYTYSGIIGESLVAVDIGIFILGCALSSLALYRLAPKNTVGNMAGIALLVLISVMFVVLTLVQPQINLFKDPMTGLTGIPGKDE